MTTQDDICECEHNKGYHPYVGRFVTWPMRCTLCECKCFTRAAHHDATARRLEEAEQPTFFGKDGVVGE